MAVSVYQPWASLLALGAKQYETRAWLTAYRGPLAIHASLPFTIDQGRLLVTPPFREVLSRAGFQIPGQLPRGCILAVGRLVAVVRTEHIVASISKDERAFGDYTPGRYAWHIDDVRLLARPLRTRGRPGLWDVTDLLDQADGLS